MTGLNRQNDSFKLKAGARINEFSTDGTMAGNSDTAVPTEKAVKAYVDGSPAGTVTLAGAESLTNKNIAMAGGTPKADTGGSVFSYGTMDAPKSVSTTVDVAPNQIYIKSITNATADDTSVIGYYVKVEAATAAQEHNHIQSILSNAKASVNFFDMYGVQGHATVGASCATQNDNAHVTGLSGKAVLTAGTTLAKGWVTGGLFILEGSGAVTQKCHGVSIVAESGVTACQSLLELYTDATVPALISTSGIANTTYLFDFNAAAGCVIANTDATAANRTHKIAIDIGGVAGFINVNAA